MKSVKWFEMRKSWSAISNNCWSQKASRFFSFNHDNLIASREAFFGPYIPATTGHIYRSVNQQSVKSSGLKHQLIFQTWKSDPGASPHWSLDSTLQQIPRVPVLLYFRFRIFPRWSLIFKSRANKLGGAAENRVVGMDILKHRGILYWAELISEIHPDGWVVSIVKRSLNLDHFSRLSIKLNSNWTFPWAFPPLAFDALPDFFSLKFSGTCATQLADVLSLSKELTVGPMKKIHNWSIRIWTRIKPLCILCRDRRIMHDQNKLRLSMNLDVDCKTHKRCLFCFSRSSNQIISFRKEFDTNLAEFHDILRNCVKN